MPFRRPNAVRFRPLSLIKQTIIAGGRRPRTVRTGLFRGIVLDLDLRSETQVYLGLYERETFRFIETSASDCTWMVDVGAASGDLAIFFMRQSRCEVVHAFEPRREALEQFRNNLMLNGLADDRRLVIHQGFAGQNNDAGSTRLDDLPLDPGKPGFLKIDVDGAEVDVLDGAARMLTVGRPDVLVEVHSEQLEADCIVRLRGFGYAVEIIDNAWWRVFVPEQRPIAHNRWLWATKADKATNGN
jgi:precorrin-6B methylase 2